ncbi:MAG: GCN5-related N-acetyltransferase [Myxococcales bacterium]|nr:GCN5-related N-acetyltransferase [Myxococcales bacterium]
MSSAPPPVEIPKLTSLPLVIETQRLTLRRLAERDVEDLWPHVSNPEVATLMSWAAHRDKAETLAWVRGRIEAWDQGTDLVWAIEHEGRACGTIALGGITWGFSAWRVDRAELGYWIGQPLWGQGLVTEAATAVTRWGFETLGLHKITIGCIEGNERSKHIIDKLGYRFLARFEDDVWRDGRWWHHLRYEMLASEWVDSTRTLRFNRPRLP